MQISNYILLAEALRNAKQTASDATVEIADALKRADPKFNREHFLAVVRGEKDLISPSSHFISFDALLS